MKEGDIRDLLIWG